MKFFIILGVIGLGLSAITSGALVNGDRQRANFHTETKEHRKANFKFSLWTGLLGGISLLIAVLIHLVQK